MAWFWVPLLRRRPWHVAETGGQVAPGRTGADVPEDGLARPPGPELALALADGFCQDRQKSRWLSSGTEKKRSECGFFGRRRDPSIRATPSFRDRGAVALRTGPGASMTCPVFWHERSLLSVPVTPPALKYSPFDC